MSRRNRCGGVEERTLYCGSRARMFSLAPPCVADRGRESEVLGGGPVARRPSDMGLCACALLAQISPVCPLHPQCQQTVEDALLHCPTLAAAWQCCLDALRLLGVQTTLLALSFSSQLSQCSHNLTGGCCACAAVISSRTPISQNPAQICSDRPTRQQQTRPKEQIHRRTLTPCLPFFPDLTVVRKCPHIQ